MIDAPLKQAESAFVNDTIIEAIKNSHLTCENISFGKLREIAGRNNGLWERLGRGRSILTSTDELDQYLYSYGLMIKNQWSVFLGDAFPLYEKMRITDYGCGQGLGIALLLDHFGSSFVKNIEEVRLIEPSLIALTRAKAVVDCYLNVGKTVIINKNFDNLSANDMQIKNNLPHLHILSNVLDIDGFDHAALFSKMFGSAGEHVVLAVSHDRAHNGGSDRFEKLEAALKDPKYSKHLNIVSSTIKKFALPDGKSTISWNLHVKVLNGSV